MLIKGVPAVFGGEVLLLLDAVSLYLFFLSGIFMAVLRKCADGRLFSDFVFFCFCFGFFSFAGLWSAFFYDPSALVMNAFLIALHWKQIETSYSFSKSITYFNRPNTTPSPPWLRHKNKSHGLGQVRKPSQYLSHYNYYYDFMQVQQNKYDKLTEVLRSFRRVPTLFEDFAKDSNPQRLKELLQIAHSILSIGEKGRGEGEMTAQLYHRFYSRMREIVHSFLNYYLNSGSYQFIREFLMAVNKQILQFHPSQDACSVLKSVACLIVAQVKKLTRLKNVSLQQFRQSIQEISLKTTSTDAIVLDERVNTISYPIDPDQSRNQEKRTTSIIKQLGLNVIPDLDRREVDSLTLASQDELLRSCTYRNRAIRAQMNQYSQLYKSYQGKSENRKNSSFLHYRPTTYTPSPTSQPVKQKKPLKEYRQYSFQKKRANFFQPADESNTQNFDEKLKQEVLHQIYETRQKCCLKKVVCVGTDLTFKPVSVAQSNKINPNSSTRWTRPRSVHRAKSQKNNFSMSIGFKKN